MIHEPLFIPICTTRKAFIKKMDIVIKQLWPQYEYNIIKNGSLIDKLFYMFGFFPTYQSIYIPIQYQCDTLIRLPFWQNVFRLYVYGKLNA